MLVGPGANAFAKEMGIEEKSTDDLITDTARQELHELLKFKNVINILFRYYQLRRCYKHTWPG